MVGIVSGTTVFQDLMTHVGHLELILIYCWVASLKLGHHNDLYHWFSAGDICLPREYLAMFGYIFGCHNWGLLLAPHKKKKWSGLKCCSAKAEKLCPIKVGGGSRALLAEYWGRDQRGRELEIWNRFITWGRRYSTCACCWEGSLHSGYMECPLRRPASLRNSVLAVLCRPGLIWGDVPMELGSHVSVRMT